MPDSWLTEGCTMLSTGLDIWLAPGRFAAGTMPGTWPRSRENAVKELTGGSLVSVKNLQGALTLRTKL